MKNRIYIIPAALIFILSNLALADSDKKTECTWKDLSISEIKKDLKAENSFSESKITTTIEIPANETARFKVLEPQVVVNEENNNEEEKDFKAKSFKELNDHAARVGIRVSFCATEAEKDLKAFFDAHQSETKAKHTLETILDTDEIGNYARAGFSDGKKISLPKKEVLSPSLLAVQSAESICVTCLVNEGKSQQAIDQLSAIGTKKAEEMLMEARMARLEIINGKIISEEESLSGLRAEILKEQKLIDNLKIDQTDKSELYAKISDMLQSLFDKAKDDGESSGKNKASSYAKELSLIANAQSNVPGITSDSKREFAALSLSYKKNGAGAQFLTATAEHKELIKKAELKCKFNAYNNSCVDAQNQLFAFKINHRDYFPEIKAQYDQEMSKQITQMPGSNQNPFVQQALKQNPAAAAVPLNQPQGPDFFASYKSGPKSADGTPLFNEGAPAVMIPSQSFGYDVNHIYQNQATASQAGSPDYISVLMSAQNRT